jgi:hypothetical protein
MGIDISLLGTGPKGPCVDDDPSSAPWPNHVVQMSLEVGAKLGMSLISIRGKEQDVFSVRHMMERSF